MRFYRHPLGWRCDFCGRRLHHGLLGATLMAIGAALMLHDRADAPWLR